MRNRPAGKEVASDTRDLRFEFHQWQITLSMYYTKGLGTFRQVNVHLLAISFCFHVEFAGLFTVGLSTLNHFINPHHNQWLPKSVINRQNEWEPYLPRY